jgi:hypothetical protein
MSDRYDMPMASAPMSAEDALIEKLRLLREKLRAGGFSEIETGRLSDTFLRQWASVISEGNHGSTGA